MINCKRCGIEITFDESRCLNANTGMPHDIRKCNTKNGYVYCPSCRTAYPRNSVCDHYKTYGWKFNQNEKFFINLIQQNYVEGEWFNRKKNRKISFDNLKENQFCKNCNMTFPKNADRTKMNAHEKQCVLQTKLV